MDTKGKRGETKNVIDNDTKLEILRIQIDALRLLQDTTSAYHPHSGFIIDEVKLVVAFCKDVLKEEENKRD